MGALVCVLASTYDPSTQCVAYTDRNGEAYFDIRRPTGVEDLWITVTGHNLETYLGGCRIERREKDVGVWKIIAPRGGILFGTTVTPSCSVYNYGIQSVSYGVRMWIDNSCIGYAWVGNHTSNTFQIVSFSPWRALREGKLIPVVCSTRLSDDLYPENDWDRTAISVYRPPGPPWRAVFYKMTYPNSGEMLSVDPQNGNIHIVYNTGATVEYAKSTDKGETWENVMEVDSGSYPSLAIDNSEMPMPRITYLKNDTVFCKRLLYGDQWHTTVIYAGNENLKPGPPVIAQTYPKELADYSYCVFPVKNLSDGTSQIRLSVFNVNEDMGPEPEEIASGVGLKSPSIAITPGDIIHIVWEENGEIYYRFGEKDSTGEFVWSDIYNISESPDVISENPVIEAYGELVIAAWKEGEPGEIYRRGFGIDKIVNWQSNL